MNYCRKCGAELAENAIFCAKCGNPVAVQVTEGKPGVVRRKSSLSPMAIVGIAVAAVAILVALVAIPILLGGWFPFTQVVGSGNAITQQEFLSGFVSVDVGSGFKVDIAQANSFKILITADDNLFEYIQVTKTGSTLVIRLEAGVTFQTSTLRAEITMPDLQEVQFSGGVIGTATGFVMSHDFDVELSGGSRLEMEGEAEDLSALCSGGSHLDLSEFPVSDAEVEFSGGSQGTVNLDGVLDADLSGGSRLYYMGSPTLGDINTSGGSVISRLDIPS